MSTSPNVLGSSERLFVRQLLAGRDFSLGNRFASEMANYVYLIGDRDEGKAILVDPAYAPAELLELVQSEGLRLEGVVLTHYHADHAGGDLAGHHIPGAGALLDLCDVPLHAHRAEIPWLAEHAGIENGAIVGHDSGDRVSVGGFELELIHTPGHTEGSQCLLASDLLLSGDTLFLDGCGRTDLPGGDPSELYESLTTRLAPVSDSVAVYPGHAYSHLEFEPMGDVRRHNPVLANLDRERWLARFG